MIDSYLHRGANVSDIDGALLDLGRDNNPLGTCSGRIWRLDSRYATAISTPVLNIYAALILIRSLWVFFIRCLT